MQGKLCVVTGATSGIGEVAATELARLRCARRRRRPICCKMREYAGTNPCGDS